MMTTKKFVAPNMNLALQKVKQELGPDAVILSHEIHRGEVHIMATLANESTLDILLSKGKPIPVTSLQDIIKEPVNEPPVQIDNNTLALQNEMAILKQMITEFKAPMSQDGMFTHAMQFFFHQKLQEMGFSNQLAKRILVDLPSDDTFEESIQHITSQLLENVKCREMYPGAKYHTFIGPSGAGKTQLIVKIILQYIKTKTIENFACIFVNHQNVRVLEESKIYARIFNVPCLYVESEADLNDALEKTKHHDTVFIDFPAFDKCDCEYNYYIPFIKNNKAFIHNTLVFPSNIKNFKSYVASHEGIINEISITKVDENPHVGEFVQFSLLTQTPLGFISTGNSYSALALASKERLEEYLKNDLCPNRERPVMNKVFNV
jgi:flagellar biosynthesis protein FlhF